jgi:hypothetical protein
MLRMRQILHIVANQMIWWKHLLLWMRNLLLMRENLLTTCQLRINTRPYNVICTNQWKVLHSTTSKISLYSVITTQTCRHTLLFQLRQIVSSINWPLNQSLIIFWLHSFWSTEYKLILDKKQGRIWFWTKRTTVLNLKI